MIYIFALFATFAQAHAYTFHNGETVHGTDGKTYELDCYVDSNGVQQCVAR